VLRFGVVLSDTDLLRICRYNRQTFTLFKAYLETLVNAPIGSATPAVFYGINGETVDLEPGMPVSQPTTTLKRAVRNTGAALSFVLGLVEARSEPTMPATVLTSGPLTLTTSQWDAITGGSGGLVPAARYYLGSSLGSLTTTPPTASGQYLVVVGSAISATIFLLKPEPPILL
jgi:hypothetical protein